MVSKLRTLTAANLNGVTVSIIGFANLLTVYTIKQIYHTIQIFLCFDCYGSSFAIVTRR